MTEVAAASGTSTLIWLLIALPLIGAAVLLLAGRYADKWGHWLGVATTLGAFGVAIALWLDMLSKDSEQRAVQQSLFTWLDIGNLQIDVAFQLDQLSMCFVLLITSVGSMIHVYSTGYMEHDPGRRRFFGYLNLFVAAMLLLVLADNYAMVYVGWEGVGLASYLLIGYYQHKPSAGVAAKKAFVVNRVGDIGMAVAIMIMFATFGSVNFQDVFAGAPDASSGVMTAIGLALLLAACGKSAQFPLQSWLLDAMEGPTPVSALIHAATMVTAGVYLIARSNPIFDLSPDAQTAVVVVGAITLLFGAIIGTSKDDIKKALAASTMSQIGYMILAVGLGPIGYVYGLFHLFTHGFFKAGMFLGAGSVMHGMNDQVDMRRFGALRTAMVATWITFGLGYLAILGIPPFAGFFSKDKIIEAAFDKGLLVGFVTVLGAGITAFYMSRLFFMTFHGKKRWTDDVHPHESPLSMVIPMAVLAVGSVASGFLLIRGDAIDHWLEPVVGYIEPHPEISVPAITAMTLGVVAVGVLIAWAMYLRRDVPEVAPAKVGPLTYAARRDLFGDAFNEAVFMRPGQWLTRTLVWFDNRVIDGAVGGTAALFGGLSARSRRTQTGYSRTYALSMLAGAVLIGLVLVLVRN